LQIKLEIFDVLSYSGLLATSQIINNSSGSNKGNHDRDGVLLA